MMIQGARLPIASGRALSRGMSFHMLSRRCMTTTTTRGSTTGLDGRVCTVLGAQWGDEGKGKLADVLAEKYAIWDNGDIKGLFIGTCTFIFSSLSPLTGMI